MPTKERVLPPCRFPFKTQNLKLNTRELLPPRPRDALAQRDTVLFDDRHGARLVVRLLIHTIIAARGGDVEEELQPVAARLRRVAVRCYQGTGVTGRQLEAVERKRLIRRESDQADRRTVLVRLNDKGIELLEGMLHDYYQRISLLMRDLSEAEQRQLTEMLLKVGGGVRHVHGAA